MAKKKTVEDWFADIDRQNKVYQPYRNRGRRVIDTYRGRYLDRTDNKYYNEQSTDVSSYNLLYANTEVTRPILYNRTPQPEVRATEQMASPARQAAAMLETAIDNSCKNYDFDKVINRVLDDYLLPGTGLVRIVYDPVIGKNKKTKEEEKLFDEVKAVYLDWRDVTFGVTKTWEDLPWLDIRGFMTQDEVAELFGDKIAGELNYQDRALRDNENGSITTTSSDFQETLKSVVEIHEVWDKATSSRLFITRERDTPLRIDDDPLTLRDFFPIPRPLLSVSTNDSLIPIPFFFYYQDQQNELEVISTRIMKLVRELKRRGVYNSTIANIEQIVNAGDNDFEPVANWDRFQQGGGIDNAVSEMDITRIAQVIQGLYAQRDQIKQIIFEIAGISDLQRAATDPRETLGAQKLKGQYGSIRVSDLQREVQRFIRDIYRMKGEIIAEQFSDESLMEITRRTEAEVKFALANYLRAQEPRQVSIDIETDSTIEADQLQEQESAVAFTAAISNLSQQLPVIGQAFGLDFTGKLVTAVLRKFKMSRGLDLALQQQIDKLKTEAQEAEEELKKNPPQEPPDPELIKVQIEQQKLQMEQAKLEAEFQLEQAKLQSDAQNKQADNQLKVAELQLKQQQLILDAKKIDSVIELGEFKASIDAAEAQIKAQKIDFDASFSVAKLQLEEEKLAVEAINPNVNIVAGA